MSNVWFTSDLHWGHKNICNFRKGFATEEEHRSILKENIQSKVNKRDTLWILGDSVFREDCLADLDDIVCTKYLVIGNHCGEKFDSWKLYAKFDKVFGITKRYNCWITHAPIHPEELRGKWCLHGHTHNHILADRRYINICPENNEYMPRDLRWLREEIEERKSLC